MSGPVMRKTGRVRGVVLGGREFGASAQGETAKSGERTDGVGGAFDQGEAGEAFEHELDEWYLGAAQAHLFFPMVAVLAEKAGGFLAHGFEGERGGVAGARSERRKGRWRSR